MAYSTETELEKHFIDKLVSQDFKRVYIKDEEELYQNLRKQLNILNKDVLEGQDLTDEEFVKVRNYLDNKKVKDAALLLVDSCVIQRDNKKINVRFVDLKERDNNIFQVTNQITVKGTYVNRYDVNILLNGLPVTQIELKKAGVHIMSAFDQFCRYKKHSQHNLFNYIQVFIISNEVHTRYFSTTVSGQFNRNFVFKWTDRENNPIENLFDFSEVFLTKEHLFDMLFKYRIVRKDNNKKVQDILLMRPYQIYAVEAIIEKIKEETGNGYVWHTTGSGKTLTSWKCAELLSNLPNVDKVFFLVDRIDLDSQTVQEYQSFSGDDDLTQTENTKHLIEKMKTEKLIVTTIQKMSRAIKKYNNFIKQFKDKKVVFIIDECHRSVFGSIYEDIKHCFSKAQFIGFTGTPRFEENKANDYKQITDMNNPNHKKVGTTNSIFKECVHKYLIKNAIKDNNVLPFKVEYIKTFDANIDEKDLQRVHDIDRKEVYEAQERLENVVDHILSIHNTETKNRKYTAIFTIQDIHLLIRYYDIFKSRNTDLRIAAIFSEGINEELEENQEHTKDSLNRIIQDYNRMFGTNYTVETKKMYNNNLSKNIKDGKIDILLVVNMYLTGFDSKKLNTLYVDRFLEWHNLIQAFSRTNRVETDTKRYGNIICYRNLKDEVDKAIYLFSDGHRSGESEETFVLKEKEYYEEEFAKGIAELKKIVKTADDIDNLESETDKEKFVKIFNELVKTKDILNGFTDFSFNETKLGITETNFREYENSFIDLAYEVKRNKESEKTSILNDVYFEIGIMTIDKINVDYILNLLKQLDLSSKSRKEKSIDTVLKQINSEDKLHSKTKLIKSFIDKVVIPYEYTGNEEDCDFDVTDSFNNFLEEEKTEKIKEFATENNYDEPKIREFIEYSEINGEPKNNQLGDYLKNLKLPLLKQKTAKDKIKNFIKEFLNEFS